MKTFKKEIVISAIITVVIFIMVQATTQQYIVEQTSMMPTIVEGQRIIINKTAYLFDSPNRGDVIVFYPPSASNRIPLIKRVIGLPGEKIEIKSGLVFINDSHIMEPYIKEPPNYKLEEYIIPMNHYFVLGDNRNGSNDSHLGWTIDHERLIGKTWLSIWPPNTFGPAPNYAYAKD